MKNLKISFLILTCAANFAHAGDEENQIKRDNFSVQETRQFVSTVSDPGKDMVAAKVPDEFDCPLFSNSPYADIVGALDTLQSAINVFPQCSATDRTNQMMSTSSVELRQQIMDAQQMQDKGETRKLGISAQQILQSANKLQDLIGSVTSGDKDDCYKSPESKKLIFSINDAFQSIAPLALDFAVKNPTIGPLLAPYLPAVAGAKAVSKGLSVLESALKYVPTLDMSKSENRLAVIKNTCSFVKLYSKVEYLTIDRSSQIFKIKKDFDTKILASQAVKKTMVESLGLITFSTSPEDEKILQIKGRFDRYQNMLGKASDELGAKGKVSEIASCSVVKTLFGMKISSGILNDLVSLAQVLKKEDQVAFKKTKLEEFEHEMNKPDVFKDHSVCSDMGQEWMNAQNEALIEMKSILSEYESNTHTTSADSAKKIKILDEDKKTADFEANKQKMLKAIDPKVIDLSIFEPGELGKRMRGMPKYLFNGPDNENWLKNAWAKVKKNGPIYDLLHNNEEAFNASLGIFKSNVDQLLNFEYRMLSQPGTGFERNSKRIFEERNKFSHLSTAYAKPGTVDHNLLCEKSLAAIKAYVDATDQLISSEGLCKMIDPVLKEPEVSIWLRRYCQDSKGIVSVNDVPAGYKQLSMPLLVKDGPMAQVKLVMEKYYGPLGCEGK